MSTVPVDDSLTERQREAIVRRAQAQIGLRVATFALVALVVLILAGLLVYLVAEQRQIADTADRAQQAAMAIQDCTTPTGKCYKNGQARTQEAVKAITDALNRLERLRVLSNAQIRSNQETINKAIKALCNQQGIVCDDLPFPAPTPTSQG